MKSHKITKPLEKERSWSYPCLVQHKTDGFVVIAIEGNTENTVFSGIIINKRFGSPIIIGEPCRDQACDNFEWYKDQVLLEN